MGQKSVQENCLEKGGEDLRRGFALSEQQCKHWDFPGFNRRKRK